MQTNALLIVQLKVLTINFVNLTVMELLWRNVVLQKKLRQLRLQTKLNLPQLQLLLVLRTVVQKELELMRLHLLNPINCVTLLLQVQQEILLLMLYARMLKMQQLLVHRQFVQQDALLLLLLLLLLPLTHYVNGSKLIVHARLVPERGKKKWVK